MSTPSFEIEPLGESDIEKSSRLIAAQWGENYRENFCREVRAMRANPLNRQFIARTPTREIAGVACVVKADIDYALWGITWVTVAASTRRNGMGAELMRRAMQHVQSNAVPESPQCVIELTTTIPEYYEKHFGFKVVDSWGTDGHTSYFMTKHLHGRGR